VNSTTGTIGITDIPSISTTSIGDKTSIGSIASTIGVASIAGITGNVGKAASASTVGIHTIANTINIASIASCARDNIDTKLLFHSKREVSSFDYKHWLGKFP